MKLSSLNFLCSSNIISFIFLIDIFIGMSYGFVLSKCKKPFKRPTPVEFANSLQNPERNDLFGVSNGNIGSEKKRKVYTCKSKIGKLNFGIILDAGSSGTRMYIYEWNTPDDCHSDPYIRPSYFSSGPYKGKQVEIKVEGGLAQIEPNLVHEYLKDFILKATQFVPREKHSSTPIYLKATAGMRLISSSRAQAILQQVREVFQNTPFRFDPKFGAQIIPGEYEGIFSWLTVNYLKGVLSNPIIPSRGMIDMGGASCQLTFEPPQVPMENSFPINLNGTSRVLYTHSYLRFGQDEAKKRYQIDNFSSININHVYEDPCFVKEYRGISKTGANFIGSGNFQSCLEKTEALTLKGPYCPTSSCAINGVYQPVIPNDLEIFATSSMFYVAKWFKCEGVSTIRKLHDNAMEVCSNLDYESYKKLSSKAYIKESDSNCFAAAYIIKTLTTGYGLELDRSINFAKQVDDVDLGWTLGAMIYEANLLRNSVKCCS